MSHLLEQNKRYAQFIGMERAIEANMENLRHARTQAWFSGEHEKIYQDVIKTQQQLLMKLCKLEVGSIRTCADSAGRGCPPW